MHGRFTIVIVFSMLHFFIKGSMFMFLIIGSLRRIFDRQNGHICHAQSTHTGTGKERGEPITQRLSFLPGFHHEPFAQSLDASIQRDLFGNMTLNRWNVLPRFAFACLGPFEKFRLVWIVDAVRQGTKEAAVRNPGNERNICWAAFVFLGKEGTPQATACIKEGGDAPPTHQFDAVFEPHARLILEKHEDLRHHAQNGIRPYGLAQSKRGKHDGMRVGLTNDKVVDIEHLR
mmetsp:Transcript_15766/g.26396  ORF Transcript_15766/g.26396 Transcript_15766/m.26396 type:complete len:231 (-) Transcript_15766:456-1148(-)